MSKTFVAAIALQLVEEGKLRLDDALALYLPYVLPHPNDITKPRTFTPPASSWSYSNSNDIALGLVIEKVTGHSYLQELERRIAQPLGLSQTELAATRRVPRLRDAGTNPSLTWAAGGIVSNAGELARFFSALMS